MCETGEVLPQSKRIRLSSVLDQGDDTEAKMLMSDEHELMLTCHAEITRGEPPPEAEPPAEQLAALTRRGSGR